MRNGNRMSIAANKVPGIRAALAWDIFTAVWLAAHNANVLTSGQDYRRSWQGNCQGFVGSRLKPADTKTVNKIAEIEKGPHQ